MWIANEATYRVSSGKNGTTLKRNSRNLAKRRRPIEETIGIRKIKFRTLKKNKWKRLRNLNKAR
jgi:hypothetical protein